MREKPMLKTVETTADRYGIFTPAAAARYATALNGAARQVLATLKFYL